MPFDPDRYHRRSVRLQGYDYSSPGSYFITLCTYARECLFGEVINERVSLSPYGEIAREEWEQSSRLRPGLEIDAFVVMPNHMHGIVTVGEPVGAHSCAPLRSGRTLGRPRRSLASFVAQYKATVARRINAVRRSPGAPVWQRNYYEHVVRGEDEFGRIVAYIEDNPRRWVDDEYHPGGVVP